MTTWVFRPAAVLEIAYSRKFRSAVITANWKFIASENTLFELKFAGFRGRDLTDPSTLGVAAVMDYSSYRFYGSSGIIQNDFRNRTQLNASVTQYLDSFLGGAHELKFGLEYENSAADNDMDLTGPGDSMFEIYALPDYYMYLGYQNYEVHTKARVKRLAGYLQDNLQIGSRLSLNLGVRLDSPRLTAVGQAGTIASFTNVAPRLGLSFDLTGDAKNIVHASYGRYYDKMTSDGFTSALPGMGEVNLYMALTTDPFDPTPENLATIADFVNRPENLYYVLPASESISVDPNLKGPYTDVFSLKYERQLFKSAAFSLEYVHKRDRGFIGLATATPHTYQEVEWTDPYLGKTISVWEQTDFAPDVWSYANSRWAKRRHNFFIATFRTRQVAKWFVMASAVYQDSQGNIDNQSSSIGAGGWGIDTNPNYTENPLVWGKLRYDRTWQFKVLGTYSLPFGIEVAGDLHVLSGVAWNPTIGTSFTGLNFAQSDTLLLEKRGSERSPWTWYLNFRLSKRFLLGKATSLEILADVFNAFNKANTAYVATEPYAIYPLSSEPAYGKAFALSNPIDNIAVPVRCVAPAGRTCRGLLAVRADGRVAAVRPFSVKAGRAEPAGAAPRPARPQGELPISISAPHALARVYDLRRSSRAGVRPSAPAHAFDRATLDGGLPLSSFTPAVRDWFERSFEAPTSLPRSRRGRPSPPASTCSSRRPPAAARRSRPSCGAWTGLAREPAAHTRLVYVSPLKALAYDVDRNLRAPLRGSAPTSRSPFAPATRPSASAPRCAARRRTSSSRRPSRCT